MSKVLERLDSKAGVAVRRQASTSVSSLSRITPSKNSGSSRSFIIKVSKSYGAGSTKSTVKR